MKVGIIGGGASGLLCAILLKKKNPNIDVTILEQSDRVGKKILQTGNGMCNLDNLNSNDCINYNTKLIANLISKYDANYIRNLFQELGLLTIVDNEGRIYPYSRKASNVLDILLTNLRINNCNIKTSEMVRDIKKVNNQYLVNNNYSFDVVILACGGEASINYEYKGKTFARSLGLRWVDSIPSLSALKVKESVKALSGIRMKANVKYYLDEIIQEERSGEILFKDEGISGIVILELSRNYNANKKNKIEIDFFSDYQEMQLAQMIQMNYHKFVNLTDALIGFIPKMIALDVIKKSNNDIRKIAHLLKNYPLTVLAPYDFASSQVMRGGIDLRDLNIETLESKENKNLYAIGEAIDVDGTCGGFNLHFAWTSAIVVANAIAKAIANAITKRS